MRHIGPVLRWAARAAPGRGSRFKRCEVYVVTLGEGGLGSGTEQEEGQATMWFPGDGLQSGPTQRLGSGAHTQSLSCFEGDIYPWATHSATGHGPRGVSNMPTMYDFNDGRSSGGGVGAEA